MFQIMYNNRITVAVFSSIVDPDLTENAIPFCIQIQTHLIFHTLKSTFYTFCYFEIVKLVDPYANIS